MHFNKFLTVHQHSLHSVPRVKRETRILLIRGRCLYAQILWERGHFLPQCWYSL